MEKGLFEWNKDSEQEMNKGYKSRDTELATMPELANFIFIWVSANALLYQRRKKANLFCTGRISLDDITEKNNSSSWALSEGGSCESYASGRARFKIAVKCAVASVQKWLPGKVGRYAKGTLNFRKQIWSSLYNRHSFIQYQELITTCLPFGEGIVFTGFWKSISEQSQIKS